MQSWSRLANNRLYAYYSRVSKVFNLYRVGKFSLLNSSKMSFASLKLLGPKASKFILMGGGAAVVWYGNRQVDLAAQALKIDPESKEQMLKVFDNIDVDKSGQLSKEELKLALDKAGMHPTQFQLDAFFKVADEDNSGEISREEWMDALTHHHDNKSKHGKDLVKGAMPNNRRQNKTLKERGLDKVTPPKPQA